MTLTQHQGSRLLVYVMAILSLLFAAIAPVHAEDKWIDPTKVNASIKELGGDKYSLNVTTPKPSVSNISKVKVVIGKAKYELKYRSSKQEYYLTNKKITLKGAVPATVKIEVVKKDKKSQLSDEIPLKVLADLIDEKDVEVVKSSFFGDFLYIASGKVKSDKVTKVTVQIGEDVKEVEVADQSFEVDFALRTNEKTAYITAKTADGVTESIEVAIK